MSEAKILPVFVCAHKVGRVYRTNESKTAALRGVDFAASAGEFVVLLGPSGSGKTTLLALLAGLLEPSEGSVELFGRPVQSYSAAELQRLRACRIGFVFQNFMLIESLTALENVSIVRSFSGSSGKQAVAEVMEILERLGIAHLASRYPTQMSQGEKQRVAVARAVINRASLILADEPTANLESRQGLYIIELLRAFAMEKQTCVIVASHDLRVAEQADRVVELRDGELVPLDEKGRQ